MNKVVTRIYPESVIKKYQSKIEEFYEKLLTVRKISNLHLFVKKCLESVSNFDWLGEPKERFYYN